METREKLLEMLAEYEVGISYKPTSIEPRSLELLPEVASRIVYTIQPIASLIPAEEAQNAQSLIENRPAFILIPGREFDATGTRHGKGFGWYDRFLSNVPKEWLRIGFCYKEQFSNELLKRESWDEPMDYVCVIDKSTENIIQVYSNHERLNSTN